MCGGGGGKATAKEAGTLTEAQNLAHGVIGEVCRVQGHLGHPSGGVFPGQGVVGGSSSIELCSGEDRRGHEWVCTEQLGGLPRPPPPKSWKDPGLRGGMVVRRGSPTSHPSYLLESPSSE